MMPVDDALCLLGARFLESSGFAIERVAFAHYPYRPGLRGALAHVVFAVLPRCFRRVQVSPCDRGRGCRHGPECGRTSVVRHFTRAPHVRPRCPPGYTALPDTCLIPIGFRFLA